jgi:cytochrome c
VTILGAASPALAAEGSAARGQRVFGACAPCHSLEPNKNMTGPSLSGVWGRKAGSAESFSRYSPALKSSSIVWSDRTLDEWITDPQQLVPGNQMTFEGIKNPRERADLLAFLREATKPGGPQVAQGGSMGGMGGMMAAGKLPISRSSIPRTAYSRLPIAKTLTPSPLPMARRASFGNAISA